MAFPLLPVHRILWFLRLLESIANGPRRHPTGIPQVLRQMMQMTQTRNQRSPRVQGFEPSHTSSDQKSLLHIQTNLRLVHDWGTSGLACQLDSSSRPRRCGAKTDACFPASSFGLML